MHIVCGYIATANNQWMINRKDKKCLLWDPDPNSIITFQDLHFSSVTNW